MSSALPACAVLWCREIVCSCSALNREETAATEDEVSGPSGAERSADCDDWIRRLLKTVGVASSLRH